MEALLKKSEIPEILDLQEELGVAQTGHIDEITLSVLDQKIAETRFGESEYIKDKLEEECVNPAEAQDFIRECAITNILKYRYKCEMEKIEKFFRDCMRKKHEEKSGVAVVEIEYDPEFSGSREYQKIFEQGGTIKTFQKGGTVNQVVTNEPRYSDVTVGELRKYASQINDKSIQRALKKGKLFDMPDDKVIRLYDNNTFEVVGGGPQIGIKQGEGKLSMSNWFGKGNVRASNVIGNYLSGVQDWKTKEQEPESSVATETTPEPTTPTYTPEAFTDSSGDTYLVDFDEKGVSKDKTIQRVGDRFFKLNPETGKYELVTAGTKEAEAEQPAQPEKPVVRSPRLATPSELTDVGDFQRFVLKSYKSSPFADAIRNSGGDDDVFGRNTKAAWDKYKDAYLRARGKGSPKETPQDNSQTSEEFNPEGFDWSTVSQEELDAMENYKKGGTIKYKDGGKFTTEQKKRLYILHKQGKTEEAKALAAKFRQQNDSQQPKEDILVRINEGISKIDKSLSDLQEVAPYSGNVNSKGLFSSFVPSFFSPSNPSTKLSLRDQMIASQKRNSLREKRKKLQHLKDQIIRDAHKQTVSKTFNTASTTTEVDDLLSEYSTKKQGGTLFSSFRKGGKFIKAQNGLEMPSPKPFGLQLASQYKTTIPDAPEATSFGLNLPDVNRPFDFNTNQIVGEGINAVGFGISKPEQLPIELQGMNKGNEAIQAAERGMNYNPNASAGQTGTEGATQTGTEDDPNNPYQAKRTHDQLMRNMTAYAAEMIQKKAEQQEPTFRDANIYSNIMLPDQTGALGTSARRALRTIRNADPHRAMQAAMGIQANTNQALLQQGAQQAGMINQQMADLELRKEKEAARKDVFEQGLLAQRNEAALMSTADDNARRMATVNMMGDVLFGTPEDKAVNTGRAQILEQSYQQELRNKFLQEAQEKSPELYASFAKAQNKYDKMRAEGAAEAELTAQKQLAEAEYKKIQDIYGGDYMQAQIEAQNRQLGFAGNTTSTRNYGVMKKGGKITAKDRLRSEDKHKDRLLKEVLHKAKLNYQIRKDQMKMMAENTKILNKNQKDIIEAIRKLSSK